MRRVLGSAALLLALASCSQAVEGSGNTVDVNYDFDSFNGFDLRGAVVAEVEQTGTDYSVTITIDDNLTKYVVSQVSGGILKIGLDRAHSYQNLHFSALIRIPESVEPVSLTVAEAAKVNLDISNSGNFVLSASEAAAVNIASGWTSSGTTDYSLQEASRVIAGDGVSNNGDININLRDASSLEFSTGSANGGNLDLSLNEASRLYMGLYEVKNIDISAGSASTATVNSVGGNITGKLTEASSLVYRGTPSNVAVTASGASTLIDGR